MKWAVEKEEPLNGAGKTEIKFAWYPVKVDYSTPVENVRLKRYNIVWLEKYKATYRWNYFKTRYGKSGFRWEYWYGESL